MVKIVLDTAQDVAAQVAKIYVKQLKDKPDSVLGLATGSTPVALYGQLVKKYQAGEIDFSKARSFNLDEYYPMKADHPQSYHYFMKEHLFDKVNFASSSIPSGEAKDPKAECKRYDKEIEDAGGIDVMLLGIGHNGHVGFNEPAVTYSMGTGFVDLSDSSISANKRYFSADEVQPTKAITMGIGDIFRSRKIILIITGENKAKIAKKLFENQIHTDVPACFLLLHPDVTVYLDKDAASLI